MSDKSIAENETMATEQLEDRPTGRDTVNVALVSGGMDSTVCAAVAAEMEKIDFLGYLDTGTGLKENKEYLETLADHLGIQLWVLRTHEQYEEKVKEHGFPGPSRHGMMFTSLKERQVAKLATVTGNKELVCWTGVRSDESSRRMRNVKPVQDGHRWTWVAPIHDWSKQDCKDYLEAHDLPKNPLWQTLGRSGDCFCGCFGSPEELLDLEAAGCGYYADWIEGLEAEVETGDHTETWAWGALSDAEQRALRADKDDAQMLLCSTCAPAYPITDGGNDE